MPGRRDEQGSGMASQSGAHLKRDIGYFGAMLLVLNGLIGAGIFALPGAVAANVGLWGPWLFLIVGFLFLAVVLSFAELASYYDTSGGPILYSLDAFGPVAGFSTGWLLFVSRMSAYAANSTVMATYVGALEPWFADGAGRALVIMLVTAGLVWSNVIGVKDGVRTMAVLTVLKITPLLIMVLAGLGEVTGATLLPGGSIFMDELGATSLLLIYAYVGFETLAVTAAETRNPRQSLPSALVRTVVAIGILYFLVMLVFVAIIPPADYASSTLVDVSRHLAGPIGAIGITIAAIFSIAGNCSQSMLQGPRLVFSLAEHGMLPRLFARINPRYSTPDVAIVATGALGLALALTGTFVQLAIASSLARLIAYVLCIAALPAVRRKADEDTRRQAYRLKGGYAIPAAGLAICIWLMLQTTAANWIAVGLLLGLGIALYLLEQRFLKPAA